MKKIFLRAGVSPLDTLDAATMINKNSIGDNVGNLIYAYSVCRALMTEEVEEITPSYYGIKQGKAKAVNEKYDAFVIPLADAFRAEFMPEIRNMTKFIKKLNIPCVINGVGLRAPFEPGGKIRSNVFDDDVKDFIKAVLDKSAIVGVRGEVTSAYLSALGFREEIDHTVIGCPSMYLNGGEMDLREPKLNPDSTISLNASVMAPDSVFEFLKRTMDAFPNHYFLPQRIQEMRLLYTGIPYFHQQPTQIYPTKITDRVYAEDRVRFFLSAPSWIDYLKTVDISVGGRMHGNIAAVLAGTPCILVPHDSRMKELTEYHCLPHIWANEVDEKTDLYDLVEKLDFQKVSREHKKNFEHYVDFLDKNGINHIFKDGKNPKEAPLDRKIRETQLSPEIKSIRNCTFDEMAERWSECCPTIDKNLAIMKADNIKLKHKISEKDREIIEMKEMIESAPVLRVAKYAKRQIKKILE